MGVFVSDKSDTETNTKTINDTVNVPKMELDTIQMGLGVHTLDYYFAIRTGDTPDNNVGVNSVQPARDSFDAVSKEVQGALKKKSTDADLFYVGMPFEAFADNPGFRGVTTARPRSIGHEESAKNARDAFDSVAKEVSGALDQKSRSVRTTYVGAPFQIVPRDSNSFGNIRTSTDFGNAIRTISNARKAFINAQGKADDEFGTIVKGLSVNPAKFDRPFQLEPEDKRKLSVRNSRKNHTAVLRVVDREMKSIERRTRRLDLTRPFIIEAEETGDSIKLSIRKVEELLGILIGTSELDSYF